MTTRTRRSQSAQTQRACLCLLCLRGVLCVGAAPHSRRRRSHFRAPAATGAAAAAAASGLPQRRTAAPTARRRRQPEAPPTEAMLGVPIFPGAQFIASYDAGRGQRYYIFGSAASFVDLVDVLPHGAEAEGRAGLRRAGDARVRRRQVSRGDDGVSAGRDDQGLPVGRVAGLSESEARRPAGALPDRSFRSCRSTDRRADRRSTSRPRVP